VPAHIRIRILLFLAVAAICGGIFVVSDLQRRSDATSFEQYAVLSELRGAGANMALAFNEAAAHGAAATGEVEEAERALLEALNRLPAPSPSQPARERELLERQTSAALTLAQVAAAALKPGSAERLEGRRDTLLQRFQASTDALLGRVASEREQARASSARRPVVVVFALAVLFGLIHLWLVERPARHERRAGRAQREFGEAIQVARCEEEAYGVLSRHVARAAGADHVTVLNRNNSADRLEPATPVREGSATARALESATPDSCLAIRLARTHHVAPGEEPLLRCDVCGAGAGQTTCVPSLVGGQVVGAVLVDHRRGLQAKSQSLVEQSVAEAAPVIANLRNLAIAEIRAATDALTGLPNQRAVHDTIKRAAALAGRTASPLALVLFDLDHFKAINDTYGHGKGDEVLAAVGAITAGTLRASDFAGRLGGEEFAVLLPSTDLDGAIDVAEKLRSAVAMIDIPGIERRITASFGVAVLPDDAGEPELLLRVADRALYSAKRLGRDRIETAGATPAAAAAAPTG
jgi:diguanylate cyclase (GGDEF)-like protein